MTAAEAGAGLVVRVAREQAADLIPRFDGTTLRFTSKASLAAPQGGGLVLGPVLLDLGEEGRLVGVTVLEERRYWHKGAVGWELPGRATPHRLEVVDPSSAEAVLTGAAEVRWDVERRRCVVLFGSSRDPTVVALGPRAYAAVEGDLLVGLLADLRGFDRA